MIDRAVLREKVPHGYAKEIARKAGVTANYVSIFLRDPRRKSAKVEMAALEVIAEYNEKMKGLLERID